MLRTAPLWSKRMLEIRQIKQIKKEKRKMMKKKKNQ